MSDREAAREKAWEALDIPTDIEGSPWTPNAAFREVFDAGFAAAESAAQEPSDRCGKRFTGGGGGGAYVVCDLAQGHKGAHRHTPPPPPGVAARERIGEAERLREALTKIELAAREMVGKWPGPEGQIFGLIAVTAKRALTPDYAEIAAAVSRRHPGTIITSAEAQAVIEDPAESTGIPDADEALRRAALDANPQPSEKPRVDAGRVVEARIALHEWKAEALARGYADPRDGDFLAGFAAAESAAQERDDDDEVPYVDRAMDACCPYRAGTNAAIFSGPWKDGWRNGREWGEWGTRERSGEAERLRELATNDEWEAVAHALGIETGFRSGYGQWCYTHDRSLDECEHPEARAALDANPREKGEADE